jgi:hypothetical protein
MKKTIIYLVGVFFFTLLLSVNFFSLKDNEGRVSLSLSNLQIASAGDETGSGYYAEVDFCNSTSKASVIKTADGEYTCTTTRTEAGVSCEGSGDVPCTPSCSYVEDVDCSNGSSSSTDGSC